MNEKVITYLNPETGGVYKGTVTDIAHILGISRKTMYKKLTSTVSKCETPTVQKQKIPTVTQPLIPKQPVIYTPNQDVDPPEGILPNGSCIYCGRKVFHKFNNQWICFNSCATPKPKSKSITL
jgi:hypothetical protein